MKKIILQLFAFILILSQWSCDSDPHGYVLIETSHGDMKVMLYNETPIHRDNFIKLASEGFYDSLLFHRVIKGFMIQGGDPDSRNPKPGVGFGKGGPGYTLDAEIGFPHFKGTLSAARRGAGNPEKKSSGSQFYIVHGTKQNDQILDNTSAGKNFQYNEEQKQMYREIGGAPHLDMDYTVFGEVVEGLEVVDKIVEEPVNRALGDRPVKDVFIKKMKVLKKPRK